MSSKHHETLAAILCAAAMIAHQVGGKAVRDALFLSNFPVTALPKMIMVSAVRSILFVLGSSRFMRQHGPARVVPILGTGKVERVRSAVRAEGVELSREQWFRIWVASAGKRLP